MNGVIIFIGSIPKEGESVHNRLHNKHIALPQSNVAGIRTLWLEVLKINRAMCGTARPINDIGPHIAVHIATRIPLVKSILLRAECMLTPRFLA